MYTLCVQHKTKCKPKQTGAFVHNKQNILKSNLLPCSEIRPYWQMLIYKQRRQRAVFV